MGRSYEKIDGIADPAVHFCPRRHPYFLSFLLSIPSFQMSKSSKSSAEITSLKATLAERDAQIAALTAAAAAAAEAKPKRSKSQKEPKTADPSKPRMLSPYLVFCAAQRELHTGEKKLTVKELGVAWKLLTDEQRMSYKSIPAPVKEPKTPKAPKEKKEKKPRDPDAPKKPLSSFMIFSKKQRAEHTGAEKLTAKILSERWNALSDEEKSGYKSA